MSPSHSWFTSWQVQNSVSNKATAPRDSVNVRSLIDWLQFEDGYLPRSWNTLPLYHMKNYRKHYRKLQSSEFIADDTRVQTPYQYSRKTVYLGSSGHGWINFWANSKVFKIVCRLLGLSTLKIFFYWFKPPMSTAKDYGVQAKGFEPANLPEEQAVEGNSSVETFMTKFG